MRIFLTSVFQRGSGLASRFAQYYPERTIGLGLLAVGWYPPAVGFDYEKMLEMCRAAFGSELGGYWQFFCEDGAEEILLEHVCLRKAVLEQALVH